MSRVALLAGATGLVGGRALDLLLGIDGVLRVHALVRRPLGRVHPKLIEHVVDYDRLELGDVRVDDVYCCLGTTLKVAGSKERFRQVDHDYSVGVARLARERGATRLGLVSSVGAAPTASSFYLRVKGETERDIAALSYETFAALRPSLLLGERVEKRTGEAIGIGLARALSFAMVGGLRAYRPVAARDVAAAMIVALRNADPGSTVIVHDAIGSLARAL